MRYEVAFSCLLAAVLLTAGQAQAQDCTVTDSTGTTVVPCGPPPIGAAQDCLASVNAESRWIWPADPIDARLRRVTIDGVLWNGEDTKCNDGSPAVYYIRPATTTEDRNKWLIVFEGGGAGFDSGPNGTLDSGMEDRWQGIGSDLHCKQKMSTDVRTGFGPGAGHGRDGFVDSQQPLDAKVGGIMNPTISSFATWNWVFLNYCSSDLWTGDGSYIDLFDMSITNDMGTFNPADDITADGFRIYFNGHNIVEHVLMRLEGPGEWVDTNSLGEKTYVWHRSILDADTIVLAGDSAGGGGVQNNLDYVRAQFPNAYVAGAIGAGHAPRYGSPGDSWFIDQQPVPAGDGVSDIEDGAIRQWSQMTRINGFVDQSCLAAVSAGEEHLCLRLSTVEEYLQANHLVRQDMADPLKLTTGTGPWTPAGFRDGLIEDYEDWSALSGISYFAPSFGTHVALTKGSYATQQMVACDQTGFFNPPQIASHTFDDAMVLLADGQSSPKIYDGRHIIAPPFVNVIWHSGSCP